MVFATTSTTSLPQGRRAYHKDTRVGERDNPRENESGLFLIRVFNLFKLLS